jgi:hypothetical protein
MAVFFQFVEKLRLMARNFLFSVFYSQIMSELLKDLSPATVMILPEVHWNSALKSKVVFA